MTPQNIPLRIRIALSGLFWETEDPGEVLKREEGLFFCKGNLR